MPGSSNTKTDRAFDADNHYYEPVNMRGMGRNGSWPNGYVQGRPSEIFRQHVYVSLHHFGENINGLVELLGPERVIERLQAWLDKLEIRDVIAIHAVQRRPGRSGRRGGADTGPATATAVKERPTRATATRRTPAMRAGSRTTNRRSRAGNGRSAPAKNRGAGQGKGDAE